MKGVTFFEIDNDHIYEKGEDIGVTQKIIQKS